MNTSDGIHHWANEKSRISHIDHERIDAILTVVNSRISNESPGTNLFEESIIFTEFQPGLLDPTYFCVEASEIMSHQ